MSTTLSNAHLLKGAVIGGIINAIINGLINWFEVKDQEVIFMTVDSISTTEHTVLGGGVVLATSLAVILTAISYLLTGKSKPPFFPHGMLLVLKNGFFSFGMMVTFSILFQRIFGSIEVTAVVSVLTIALIAGIAATVVDYSTKKALLPSS